MAWNRTYWDILDGFYWSPRKLGLKSIPRSKMTPTEGGVIVPNELLNPTGPLYRRVGNAATAYASLGSLEEPLNDVFDLTMAIASDEIRRRLLFAPLGIKDDGSIEMVASYSPNGRSHEVRRISALRDRFRASWRRGQCLAPPA